MIVCVCNRVSDREIARHVQAGLDFSDIQLELGVATQCGQCEGCARELVDQCAAAGQVPALQALHAQAPLPTPMERPVWFFSPA